MPDAEEKLSSSCDAASAKAPQTNRLNDELLPKMGRMSQNCKREVLAYSKRKTLPVSPAFAFLQAHP
ncbi:hypothetical protein [Brucella tritici]|uniref:Uncharacterized protein n=1 Tax=Brucella tritici TaxID=94626 RepID=A0A6L3Y8Z3_9HYPH|nr:hypothetical protein [Brucella tritici]KAB2678454.1 hypothetical protein F9L08_23900 [Brucella tritici]